MVDQTSAGILSQTLNDNLPAGNYVLEVASQGGVTDNNPAYNNRQFFDMGSYFLTGSIPVTEPETWALAATGALAFVAARSRHRPGGTAKAARNLE